MSAVKTIKPLRTTLNNVSEGEQREPLGLTSQLTIMGPLKLSHSYLGPDLKSNRLDHN